ncbi:hypothetical protein FOZ60_005744 [Perkinsus olseni]|uniref:Uncharacterized protein n=1 Tax=Perkinsus olseni TaxID=32597 RepID=A0A7J6NQW2_PEROL|nr:hypothetical protein FOZ60_005744 [Perkinsus olseni]
MIKVIIAFVHFLFLVYADAFWANDTIVSSGQSPLRSLRLPVVAEEPPNCLPPTVSWEGKNYCWYILKNNLGTEVHSGMLILSNTSGWSWYVTLEHLASVSGLLPTDVGVWAEGRTRLTTSLPSGITVDLDFSIPEIGKWHGVPVGDEKKIEFKVELSTIVNIPYMGVVGGKNQIQSSVTAIGDVGDLFSEIVFYAEVWAEDLEHWNYDCYVEMYISGLKDGFKFEYDNILPVFHENDKSELQLVVRANGHLLY